MNQFPRHFPGKISTLGTLECPLCREPLNGLSNLFVLEDMEAKDEGFQCPYDELLSNEVTNRIECGKLMKLTDLHRHLIQFHNQTVKCPNCSQWLCDGEQNMEDLLQFHIMKNCQMIKCHGCDRTGNMLNMYMHSVMGQDHVCNTAKQMFHSFGQQLAECFYVFEETESLDELAHLMLMWLVQYMYQRHISVRAEVFRGSSSAIEVCSPQFARIFNAFILQCFAKIHAPLIQSDLATVLNKLLKLIARTNTSNFEEEILLLTSEFSKLYNQRLDKMSRLPFCYRILVMSLSNVVQAKIIAGQYPKDLTSSEQAEISKLIELYEMILPDPNHNVMPMFQFSMQASE